MVGRVDVGEADRVVRLLSAEAGRVAVLARGVRRSVKRFGGVLDLASPVEVTVRQGRGELAEVVEARLRHAWSTTRTDLHRLALATHACEVTSMLAGEHQAEPRLFGLLDTALAVVDGAADPPGRCFRWGLELKALAFAGLRPHLDACAVCEAPWEGEPLVCSAEAGGALHRRCGHGSEVTVAFVEQLRRCLHTPLVELIDVQPVPGPPWVCCDLVAWHAGAQVRTRSLLAGLEAGG